jgi:hypothetical protein
LKKDEKIRYLFDRKTGQESLLNINGLPAREVAQVLTDFRKNRGWENPDFQKWINKGIERGQIRFKEVNGVKSWIFKHPTKTPPIVITVQRQLSEKANNYRRVQKPKSTKGLEIKNLVVDLLGQLQRRPTPAQAKEYLKKNRDDFPHHPSGIISHFLNADSSQVRHWFAKPRP